MAECDAVASEVRDGAPPSTADVVEGGLGRGDDAATQLAVSLVAGEEAETVAEVVAEPEALSRDVAPEVGGARGALPAATDGARGEDRGHAAVGRASDEGQYLRHDIVGELGGLEREGGGGRAPRAFRGGREGNVVSTRNGASTPTLRRRAIEAASGRPRSRSRPRFAGRRFPSKIDRATQSEASSYARGGVQGDRLRGCFVRLFILITPRST